MAGAEARQADSRGDNGSAVTLAAVVGAILVVVVIPLWLVRYPPLFDYPYHLAHHYIGSAIVQSPDLQKIYEYGWRPAGNLAGEVIYLGIGPFLRPEVAERVVVAIAMGLFVIAPFLLNRVLWGRWSAGPLLGSLLAFNAALRAGLENFLIAGSLAIIFFALWIAWRPRMTVWRLVVFAGLSTVVYFAHTLGFILLGLLVGPYELQRAWSGEGTLGQRVLQLVRHGLCFVPGLLIPILYPQTTAATVTTFFDYGGLESRIVVLLAPTLMYQVVPDAITLLVVLLVVGWRMLSTPRPAIHRSLLAVLVVLLVACLAIPSVVRDVRAVHIRLPAMFLLVLVGAVDWGSTSRRHQQVVARLVAVALVVRSVFITGIWLRHDAEVTELRAAMLAVAPGSSVLVAVNPAADPGSFLWYAPTYSILDRQIYTPGLYSDTQLLRLKPPYLRISDPVPFPVPVPDLPQVSADAIPGGEQGKPFWNTWWRDFTYLVVLTAAPMPNPFPGQLAPVGQGSFFVIYRISSAG
jgi:hypothetical protein